jgi:hypothetical protein
MRLWGWRVDRAPATGEACFRCALAIEPDERSIVGVMAEVQPFSLSLDGDVIEDAPDSAPIGRYHLRCAVDADVDQAITALRASRDPSEPVRTALGVALARVAVRRSLLHALQGGRGRRADPPSIEPARDPLGRPRVRVLMVGSASTAMTWTWEALQQRTRDGAVPSPLREYVLQGFSFLTANELHRDPSQPVVASVFATILGVRVVKAQRDKLASLRASGLPTPLLWVLGRPESPDALDRAVTDLRSELDRAGFSGDDALVRCAEFVDDRALEELGLALDEAFSLSRPPRTFEDAVDHALAALEDALHERESARISAAMTALGEVIYPEQSVTARAAERARAELTALAQGRVRAAATASLRVASCRRAAIAVLTAVRASESALADVLAATLDESPRSLPEGFLPAWELLVEADAVRAWRLLARAFAHGTAPRRRALDLTWNRCALPEIATVLCAEVSAMRPRDPRRAEALALAAVIEARAARDPSADSP